MLVQLFHSIAQSPTSKVSYSQEEGAPGKLTAGVEYDLKRRVKENTSR